MPENVPGEFQADMVDGDWPGEGSSLMERPTEFCAIDDAVLGINSISLGTFFR